MEIVPDVPCYQLSQRVPIILSPHLPRIERNSLAFSVTGLITIFRLVLACRKLSQPLSSITTPRTGRSRWALSEHGSTESQIQYPLSARQTALLGLTDRSDGCMYIWRIGTHGKGVAF